ncbi:MAG: class I SAM-dependent methyltransferase [Anaerolineales bacterium]|nr:class I SAM-dependent methyltransferase [Anaerolineales bacterium]
MDKVNAALGNVQKTLFLPLWGRAVESKKTRPMLVDDTAVRIIEQVDYDFSQITRNMDDLSQIAWIRRSMYCDRVIREFLQGYPEGTIVNIGCGLDTTFERTDNGKLKWYDLDLPDVIELRSKFVQENERRKFIPASFLEEAWLEEIEVNGNVLFLAAGVFYYFQENEIKDFLIRLTDRYPGSELFFDVSSPIGVRVANKKVVAGAGLDEKSHLVWGLENKKEILAWDPGIKLLGTYYYYRTLHTGLRNILMGLLSDVLGIQYMLHLKLGG